MTSNVELLAAGALYGFCHATLFPVLLAYLMDYAPVHVHGRMSLLYQFFWSLGIFFASNIGGIIAEQSIEYMFFTAALFACSGLLLLIIVLLRKGITRRIQHADGQK
jgi:MFS family permease